MTKQKALQPIEQREVPFYGDQIVAVRVEGSKIYVPIRPICDLLGINWATQFRKLRDDDILSEVSMSVVIRQQTSPNSKQPKHSEMVCLPLDYLNGWLFAINAKRVKASVREGLLRYQREAYRVLFEAFTKNEVTHQSIDVELEALLASDDPSAVAYRHAMAIANIAREQLVMKAQYDARLNSAEAVIADNVTRLDAIEAELGNPERFISVAQAADLSQAVRAVATIFSKHTGQNEFGAVYGELYRRYSINSYKRLPERKLEEAIAWLRDWYSDLTDEDVPF